MYGNYATEFLGTMLLSFIIFSTHNSLAIGIALAVAIFMSAGLSLGSFNPAVTIALLINKNLNIINAMLYILFEVLGALIGYLIYYYLIR
jgi:aquaporin Z